LQPGGASGVSPGKRGDLFSPSLAAKVNNKLDFEILINPRCGKKVRELSVYTQKLIYTKLIYVNLFTRGTWPIERKKKNIFPSIIRPRFLFKFLFLSNQERRIFIDQKSPRLFVPVAFFSVDNYDESPR